MRRIPTHYSPRVQQLFPVLTHVSPLRWARGEGRIFFWFLQKHDEEESNMTKVVTSNCLFKILMHDHPIHILFAINQELDANAKSGLRHTPEALPHQMPVRAAMYLPWQGFDATFFLLPLGLLNIHSWVLKNTPVTLNCRFILADKHIQIDLENQRAELSAFAGHHQCPAHRWLCWGPWVLRLLRRPTAWSATFASRGSGCGAILMVSWRRLDRVQDHMLHQWQQLLISHPPMGWRGAAQQDQGRISPEARSSRHNRLRRDCFMWPYSLFWHAGVARFCRALWETRCGWVSLLPAWGPSLGQFLGQS